MNFFTSDLHLGSNQALKNDNRPFKNAKIFEKFLIKTWNKQSSKNDTIYVVGDMFDCHMDIKIDLKTQIKFVKKIKAKIILIIGNNEERIIKYFFNNNFENFRQYCIKNDFFDVKQNDTLKICNIDFYLTHKPKNYNTNLLNLFGHSHRAMGIYKSFGFNVGCDLNHFKLYSENDIKQLLKMKSLYWDKDENLKLV